MIMIRYGVSIFLYDKNKRFLLQKRTDDAPIFPGKYAFFGGKIEEWVGFLQKLVPSPDENTFFVGHSIGCQTILRYLEKLEDKNVEGAVFVAGWFSLTGLETDEEKEIARPWLETPIDFERLKEVASSFTAILSTNDPYVPLKETKKIFEAKLGAKVVVEENKGHFTEGDDVFELPIILDLIQKSD